MNQHAKRMFKLKADVIAAVGHPIRLAIIDFLKDGEQCVCDIAGHVGAQRSNVSRHLTVLLNVGIVEQRKEGLKMFYTLKTHCIVNFMRCVEGVLLERAHEAASMLQKL